MGQPFIGEIRMFGGNFAPAGWALCNGQLMPIAENDALFQLIGTTYGGDGQSTFRLPDLLSRVPIHMGTGGGSSYVIGESGGIESVTLTTQQIPAHNHFVQIAVSPGNASVPASNTVLSNEGESIANAAPVYAAFISGVNQSLLAPQSVGIGGGSQPHDNIQPILAINYIISLYGVFPPRS